MADVSDPLELYSAEVDISGAERDKSLQELRAVVGQYTSVRDLILQPGWPILINALEKRSVFWKERALELLTSILLRNDKASDSAFLDARTHHLATEEAINIILVMRVDARDAQEKLDKMAAKVRNSTENG